MTAIIDALSALNTSLDRLEAAAMEQQQKSRAAQQRDLFNGSGASARRNVIAMDPAVLARKLDIAIERVEQVLREG